MNRWSTCRQRTRVKASHESPAWQRRGRPAAAGRGAPPARPEEGEAERWKILVVDDEEEVHVITRLALDDFCFADRNLEFINAYSGAEARTRIAENPDIAVILLDVVMEADDAGLQFARYVRQDLGNHFVRIILRTGQPGLAPERRVLRAYDINDYRAKTELTQERLFTVMYTALGSYRDLLALARSRQQLTGLVDEMEQYAYITARDLREPLKKLVGHMQAFRQQTRATLDPVAARYLEEMWGETVEVYKKVDSLVTLTQAGHFNESRDMVDCRAVVDDVLVELDEEVRRRQASIAVGELPTVYVSRRQMLQLFSNLLSNALKFQPDHPPRIDVSAQIDGRYWRFAVADNGIGIAADSLKSIFTPLRRTQHATGYEGSGVGLAICEKVVHWHGGRIWVESTPAQGSTFYFTLPVAD